MKTEDLLAEMRLAASDPECNARSLLLNAADAIENIANEIADWLEGKEPYHRDVAPGYLPGRQSAIYAANREPRWSEPFSLGEAAEAIRRMYS